MVSMLRFYDAGTSPLPKKLTAAAIRCRSAHSVCMAHRMPQYKASTVLCAIFSTTLVIVPDVALGRSSSSGHSSGHSSHSYKHSSKAVPGVTRDSHGRIARSPSARHEFQRSNPCPSTGKTSGYCPGYVIDHVTPLKRGGADHPSNMQWQTKEEAKIKDKTE